MKIILFYNDLIKTVFGILRIRMSPCLIVKESCNEKGRARKRGNQ